MSPESKKEYQTDTPERLTFDELTPFEKWLGFRVKAKLVDSFVLHDPRSINVDACRLVVKDEIDTLQKEEVARLQNLKEIIPSAEQHHGKALSFDDYTSADLDNLYARYNECEQRELKLSQLLEDDEALTVLTDRLINVVRESSYQEAIQVLQDLVKASRQKLGEQAAMIKLYQLGSERSHAATWDDEVEPSDSSTEQ